MHDDQAVDECGRLVAFRRGLYGCFRAWPDALFEVSDAAAGAGRSIRSIAELSLEPELRRGWGSGYQALERGRIEVAQLTRLGLDLAAVDGDGDSGRLGRLRRRRVVGLGDRRRHAGTDPT